MDNPHVHRGVAVFCTCSRHYLPRTKPVIMPPSWITIYIRMWKLWVPVDYAWARNPEIREITVIS